MTAYRTRLEAVERKLTPEAQLLVVTVWHEDDEATRRAKINAAAAARGVNPDHVRIKVFVIRWTRPASEATP